MKKACLLKEADQAHQVWAACVGGAESCWHQHESHVLDATATRNDLAFGYR